MPGVQRHRRAHGRLLRSDYVHLLPGYWMGRGQRLIAVYVRGVYLVDPDIGGQCPECQAHAAVVLNQMADRLRALPALRPLPPNL